MKKETEIAESHIEELDLELPLDVSLSYPKCQEHKASCQRFLDWILDKTPEGIMSRDEEKITDLKNAIRKYEENGI